MYWLEEDKVRLGPVPGRMGFGRMGFGRMEVGVVPWRACPIGTGLSQGLVWVSPGWVATSCL